MSAEDVGAVKAPTIRRSIHANDYDNRSRHCKVSLPGARRLCCWPGGHPSPVEASVRSGVLSEVTAMPDWHRSLRVIALLVTGAAGTGSHCTTDAAGLCEALRQAAEE